MYDMVGCHVDVYPGGWSVTIGPLREEVEPHECCQHTNAAVIDQGRED